MRATKSLKELPWPEQSVCNIEQVDYIVFSQIFQIKREKFLVVTFKNNTIKPQGWAKRSDFRLFLSAERRDYTVLYKGGTESNKLPGLDNCYPEISRADETRLRTYLSLETPWTGKAAAAKDTEDGNHQMRRLSAWCIHAKSWQKEERKRRRGEIEDEAVELCPEELPEGLIEYIRDTILPEDEVLLYMRGNVRGTCYACRQKVRAVAPNRFRQGEYTYCPECGKKVACVLESGMNFKADYVNNLAAFQLGADGKTLFIRHWHLKRDPTAQWEHIPNHLVETTRYAMRGNRVAKWSHEEKYAWGYIGPYVRKQRDSWERVQGTQVYDGGYYFYLDEGLVQQTELRYAGLADYMADKLTRQGRNVIRFALDSARYPVMEFLFKAGYYRLLREAIQGTEHRHAIRWNAKKLKDAFRFPLRMLKTREPEEWSFSELWELSQIWEKWGAQKSDRELLDIMMLRTRLGENGEDMVLPFTTAARAGAYLRAQERQESGAGNLYKDYLKDCAELGLNLRDKQVLFPPHLREAHARTISMKKVKANDKIRGAFSKAAKKGRKWNLTGKRLLIRVAESPEELIREGKLLSHCVGGYAEDMADGELLIFFVRRVEAPDEPFYTLDLRHKSIYQCRTTNNQSYEKDAEVKAFVDSWLEKVVKKNDRRKTA